MRLLKRAKDGTITLTYHSGSKDTPQYAILSHTWGADEDEATFQDLGSGTWQERKLGAKKIQLCADQAAEDGLQYFWIDTCCIDKTSSSELQEAINSMFHWYSKAKVCYAYLADVSVPEKVDHFHPPQQYVDALKQSRWFTRGWTLQELLAPHHVEFYSAEWTIIGTRRSLGRHLADVTAIPAPAFHGLPLSQFSVEDRLAWGAKRSTKREEDAAYSLFGIFGISMPLLYGEGRTKAMRRLNAEIKKDAQYLPSALVPSGKWNGYESTSSGGEDANTEVRKRRQSFITSAPSGQMNVPVTPVGKLYTPQNDLGASSQSRTQSQQTGTSISGRSGMGPSSGHDRDFERHVRFEARGAYQYRPQMATEDFASAPRRPPRPPRHYETRFGKDTIIVSCNRNASEISVSVAGRMQTFRPPQPLLSVDGDRQVAARSIKAFVEDRLGRSDLDDKDIELHWAIPLMTPDSGRAALRNASIGAGFSPHSRVVSEVEAVSSPTLFRESNNIRSDMPPTPPDTVDTQWPVRRSQQRRRTSLEEEERTNMLVLLCNDSGCEMAAYSLSDSSGNHKEVALSKAVDAGWNELEYRLRQWMQQRFGSVFVNLDPSLAGANSTFMIAFEQFVCNLSETSASWQPGRLPLRMDYAKSDAYDSEQGCVLLDSASMLSLLIPLIEDICSVMTDMITELLTQKDTFAQIVLMGSFIDVPYIKTALESHARMMTKGLVRITYQPDASVTVGAIVREVENVKPTSIKALRHYGCIYGMSFREGIDPPRKAYFDMYSERKMCNHRVEWLIRKGQDITPQTKASSRNVFSCDIKKPIPVSELKFVTSSLDKPPDWSDSPGIDPTNAVIQTQFTTEEVKQRFTPKNGRHGLTSVVKLSLGSELGVLQAERNEDVSGLAMGHTSIRFE